MTRRTTLLLAALAAAIAALCLPAVASATLTSAVAGANATFTGDAGNDNLVIDDNGTNLTHNQTGGGFNSDIDFDTGTAGDQTLPANNTAEIDANLGAGQDTSLFNTTQVLRGDLDGEDGDDTLSGSDGGDTLKGGNDDDRVVGFRGADDMEGGAGNDVLVWNNGDGSDTMDGDAGNGDVVEVNGSNNAGDIFTIAPGANGRVDFDRLNLVPFSLDIGGSERIQVNGLVGDDTISSLPGAGPLIAHELNGGVGADTIAGGESADLITGGDDIDTLHGGGGADRLVADRGNDTMNGDAGDDTMVWNNGDGTDAMNGGDGQDRVEVNGSPTGADVFTIKPAAGGARFDRTNVGLFGLDIATSELLEVNALGGNDSLTASSGTPLEINADGGEGDDALTGANERDALFGGSGNDTLTAAGGHDLLDGQAGNDTLNGRDGLETAVRCGTGTDTATVDGPEKDSVDACETVNRPAVVAPAPAPAPAAPAAPVVAPPADRVALPAVLAGGALRLGRNQRDVALSLSCPAGEAAGCRVLLRLESAAPISLGGVRVIALLGTVRANLRAGETRRVVVRIPARLARVLARRGRSLALRAEIRTLDGAGNVVETAQRLSLRLPRR